MPKVHALLADAMRETTSTKIIDVASGGTCLLIASGTIAEEAAAILSAHLAVTLLTPIPIEGPWQRSYDMACGELQRLSGALGRFSVVIAGFRQRNPSGRGDQSYGAATDRVTSECDIIVDLSGGQALVSAPEKRDGYLRADPGNRAAVVKTCMEAIQLVGTFEKPLYIDLTEHLCAHKAYDAAKRVLELLEALSYDFWRFPW